MDKVNVIIPCCGRGQRFIDAGYKSYKPTLDFLNKPIIQHIIDAFPKHSKIWIITDKSHLPILKNLLINYPNINFIEIEEHKNGPAWSVWEAGKDLPIHESGFVVYNDVWWKWDFNEVENFINSHSADGIVFTHTGFHPHIFKNSFSAFCLSENNKLKEIKEKGCFTDNHMLEPLSTGVYYFGNINLMLYAIGENIKNDQKIAGEFYPSVVFNNLIKQNKNIFTYETRPFLHLGTPEQYEDALNWQKILKQENKAHTHKTMIMMCGTGSRMKNIAEINKAGIIINEIPMYKYVAQKMASKNNVFLVNDNTTDLLEISDNYLNIGVQTQTQTQSLQNVVSHITSNQSLLICSNDCYGFFNTEELNNFKDADAVVFGFRPRLMHRKQENAHSGFNIQGKNLTKINYKNALDSDFGFAGMCFFPNTNILQEISKIDPIENPSIDNFIEYLINKNYKIGYIVLEDYVHLGTPEEYQEFEFWKGLYEDEI